MPSALLSRCGVNSVAPLNLSDRAHAKYVSVNVLPGVPVKPVVNAVPAESQSMPFHWHW